MPKQGRPWLRMRWGLSSDTRTLFTRLYRQVTGGDYCHVFPIFYTAEPAEPIYFESIWKKDERTGKTGVRGPYPLSKVYDWAAAGQGRQFHTLPVVDYLPFTDDECEAAYKILAWAEHAITYAPLQIVQNWVAQRLRLHFHVGRGSRTRWTCSETCMRVVPPRLWGWYGMLDSRADDVAPSGKKCVSIENSTRKLLAQKGTIGAP